MLRTLHFACSIFACALAFNVHSAFAQCPNDNQLWYIGSQPPCAGGTVNIGGGTFATFTVTAGMTYTFSTCNSSFNTMLTGYDNTGTLLFSNDDNGPDCATNRASVEWLATVTGLVKVLVDSATCTSYTSTSAVLTYRQRPTITSSTAAMCSGETRTLTGTPPGGAFSGNGVVGNTFTAPDQNGPVPITYVFSGCAVVQNIQVNKKPLASIVSLDSVFCTGDSVLLVANVTPGSGTVSSYQWKMNGSNIASSGSTLTVSQGGSYTVEVTNSNSCVTESATFTVTELPPPVVSFTGLAPDYCITDPSITLSGTPPGGTFSGSGVGGNSFVPFLAGMGTHDITYAFTGVNGCRGTQTQTTVVTDVPVISFSVSPVACENGAPVSLNATPSGGTYSGVGVAGNSFDPTVAGVGGPYVITYTFTDTIGCGNTSSANQSINVVPQPSASISGLVPKYCENAAPVVLTGIPGGGVFSGTGVVADTFAPALAGGGTHVVTYTYTDGNGCSDSQSASTLVNALPVVQLAGLDSVYCEDDAVVQMSATPLGGTFSGVGLIANAFNPAGAGAGGPYLITYSYTDNNGCTGTDTLQVSVHAIPTVAISGLDPVYCVYLPDVPLTLSPAGGQLLGTGVNGNSFNPNAAGVGTHILVYSYADNAGCANSTQETVTVDACVGIQQINPTVFEFHPNPTTGKISVTLSGISSQALLRVYNMPGQQLLERAATNGIAELDLTEFSKGVYLLRLISEKETLTRKVLVE